MGELVIVLTKALPLFIIEGVPRRGEGVRKHKLYDSQLLHHFVVPLL